MKYSAKNIEILKITGRLSYDLVDETRAKGKDGLIPRVAGASPKIGAAK
jgi:hypothetical protein